MYHLLITFPYDRLTHCNLRNMYIFVCWIGSSVYILISYSYYNICQSAAAVMVEVYHRYSEITAFDYHSLCCWDIIVLDLIRGASLSA